MNSPISGKQILRKELIVKRLGISPSENLEYSKVICSNFEKLATYRYADGYLMYFPLRNEVNVKIAMEMLLKKGKKIYLPRCSKSGEGIMDFFEICSFDDLEEGAFKVMEPKEYCQRVEVFSNNTVCIVPGIAFDQKGYRLGYGKGYYDRFLRDYKGTKIGVVFSDFLFDTLPRGKYDTAVDVLVTEKGVIRING